MSPTGEGRPFGFFQIVVLVLSIYALTALLVDMVVPLKPETSKLIHRVDYFLCAIFFSDFVYQLARAEKKWAYLRVGWIDLLASIPMVDALRWGRLFRVIRILRVIRSTQNLRRILRERNAVGGSVFLAAFMFVVLSSLLMLTVETSDRSNIKTGGDALWWSITTMTTVGYGDLYPVTPLGRIVAAVLMLCGVGLFGAFTALVASHFVGRQENEISLAISSELEALRVEIKTLREQLISRPLNEEKG